MSHKTLVQGTAYDIKGGRTLINGTGYDIKGGRTLINGTRYDIKFSSKLVLYDYTTDYNNAQNGQLIVKTGLIFNNSGSWENKTDYAKITSSGIYLSWVNQQQLYQVMRQTGILGISGIDFTDYKILHAQIYGTSSTRGIALGYVKTLPFDTTPDWSTSYFNGTINMDGYTKLQHTSGSSNFPSGVNTEITLDITSVTGEQCVEAVGSNAYIRSIWLT